MEDKNTPDPRFLHPVGRECFLFAFISSVLSELGCFRGLELQLQLVRNQSNEFTIVGQYIVRYASVLSNRFDSTAFKKVMPEIYKAYTKQVSSRRFTISV